MARHRWMKWRKARKTQVSKKPVFLLRQWTDSLFSFLASLVASFLVFQWQGYSNRLDRLWFSVIQCHFLGLICQDFNVVKKRTHQVILLRPGERAGLRDATVVSVPMVILAVYITWPYITLHWSASSNSRLVIVIFQDIFLFPCPWSVTSKSGLRKLINY